MSVINDEDDLEREALDLYKRCVAQAFGRYLDEKEGLLGTGKTIEGFGEEFEGEAADHLAGICLSLIASFMGESKTVIEKAIEGEGEG